MFLGCSSRTVADTIDNLRGLIIESLNNDDTVIGGEGIVIEIDEAKFGKRKYSRGHLVEGAWVLGGVERTPERKVFLKVVEQRGAGTLLPIILQHVAPGSVIHTDLWRAYAELSDNGYVHRTVNHSMNFRDPQTGTHTNTIEGTWNGIKLNIAPRERGKN